jgi:hypothetical protein
LPEIQQKVNDVRLLLQGKGYLMLASVLVPKSDVFLQKRACRRHSNIAECNGQSTTENLVKGDKLQVEEATATTSSFGDPNNKNSSTQAAVTCDSFPCNGFFAYDGPNRDTKSAMTVMKKTIETYSYGNERNNETVNKMIFMPKNTEDGISCVKEWRESGQSWRDR